MKEIYEAFKFWLISKFEVSIKLDRNRDEIEFLRNQILYLQKELNSYRYIYKENETQPVNNDEDEPEVLHRKPFVPWSVKKRELEAIDRIKANNIKAEYEASRLVKISELEKELGVNNVTANE